MLCADGRNRGCNIRAGERGWDCPGRIPEALSFIHESARSASAEFDWRVTAEGGFNAALLIHQMSMG